MRVLSSETIPVRQESDLVLVGKLVRERAKGLGFGVLDLTKTLTAASELGRNTLAHGGGGTMVLETLENEMRRGLRLTFEDHGPGIEDIALAMTDLFTTNGGMGLGLSGSKRLMDEFEIASRAGEGTRVMVTQWT